MSDHVWADVHHRAVESFGGQTPGRELEASIVERFEQAPEAVASAIEKLGARFAAGRVHSPWPLVLRELDELDRSTIVADGRQERGQALRLAEAWIRNAGLYAPESEALAELFDQRGRLRFWPELRPHISEAWMREQPRAELAELERAERNARQSAAYFATRRQVGEPHDDGGDGGPGQVEHPPPPVTDPDAQPSLEASAVGAPLEDLWPSREQPYPDEQGWRRWADGFDAGDG